MTATTNFIHHAEPTVRSNAALAYSQCLPESDFPYSPAPQHGSDNLYAPVPPQPLPVQTPVTKSSSAAKGLLFVAGLAVVGAAAFGGVMLLNDSQTAKTTTAGTTAASDVAGSTVVNLPSAVDVPALAPAQNATTPVIVDNPAPVHVSGPVPSPRTVAVPRAVAAPAPQPDAVPAPAPIAAPAPAPAAPAAPNGPGLSIKTPGVEIGVPGDGGVSVKTPGVEVGVPGHSGGDVEVAVGGKPADDVATPDQ